MERQELVSALMQEGVLVTEELLEQVQNGEQPEDVPKHILKRFEKPKPRVIVKKNYDKKDKKKSYDDFVQYWRHRFNAIMRMLRSRTELQGVTSINRLQKQSEGNIATIAMIQDKNITSKGSVILKLEDLTGEITAIVSQRDPKLLEQATNLVLDEVIGITGNKSGDIIYVNKIVHPDIPITNELKKQKKEEYMIVIGDPEIGGKQFLHTEWSLLTKWIKGELGSDQQKEVAKKTKYIVIVGDLVSGVGVYPNQDKELVIKDIYEQYDEFAKLIKQFPEDKEIILCPGNHDAGRIAEPQPAIYKEFAQAIYDLPNTTMVSSPAVVNIGQTKDFPGFDILLYHGYSLIYYSDNIPLVRNSGGQKATDKIMKYLLQKRHLAPSHGSVRYIPDREEDPLVIDTIPDFFLTGHIHRIATGNYRGVTMINAGAWTDKTVAQIKRGLEPQPARLPIINLQTRELSIMNFYQGEEE